MQEKEQQNCNELYVGDRINPVIKQSQINRDILPEFPFCIWPHPPCCQQNGGCGRYFSVFFGVGLTSLPRAQEERRDVQHEGGDREHKGELFVHQYFFHG